MVSIPLNPPAEREYIIADSLGRTMIYHIREEGEGKGEKPEPTAVGEGLGSLVGAGDDDDEEDGGRRMGGREED